MNYLPIQVKEILNKIDFSLFDREDFNSKWVENEFFYSKQYEELRKNNIDVKYGISKLVFIPKKYNFVVKIPFLGSYNDNYDVNYISENDDDDYDYDFIPFKGAIYPISNKNGNDYCRSEVEYYQLAKKYHFEELFCETIFISKKDNIPVYISEKAKGSERFRCLSKEEKEDVTNLMLKNNFPYKNATLVHALLQFYDLDYITKFVNFLFDNNIGDLHTENYGENLITHKPILIDYSNFWD